MSKLTQLKGEVVTLRNKIESGRGTLPDVLSLNRKRKLIDKLQKFFIRTAMWSIVSAVILTSGCRSALLGTGQALRGIGQGTGTVIVGVGNFLVEEGQ